MALAPQTRRPMRTGGDGRANATYPRSRYRQTARQSSAAPGQHAPVCFSSVPPPARQHCAPPRAPSVRGLSSFCSLPRCIVSMMSNPGHGRPSAHQPVYGIHGPRLTAVLRGHVLHVTALLLQPCPTRCRRPLGTPQLLFRGAGRCSVPAHASSAWDQMTAASNALQTSRSSTPRARLSFALGFAGHCSCATPSPHPPPPPPHRPSTIRAFRLIVPHSDSDLLIARRQLNNTTHPDTHQTNKTINNAFSTC